MNRLKKIGYYLLGFTLVAFLLMRITGTTINDIGLKVLSGIKWITGNSVDIQALDDSNKPVLDHQVWTDLLQAYVSPIGEVSYEGFIGSAPAFNHYLHELSINPPGKNWSDDDVKAYWINAYNAFTVKLIIDHYPVKSIKDISDGMTMIGSSWDLKFFKIGGVEFDLNTIEHSILRENYSDYRIHFALNCASKSCPALRNEAFVGSRLELQLDQQASFFINNVAKNKISSSSTQISSIFRWFSSDFEAEQTLNSILKKYHLDFNSENAIEYLPYDWLLNE